MPPVRPPPASPSSEASAAPGAMGSPPSGCLLQAPHEAPSSSRISPIFSDSPLSLKGFLLTLGSAGSRLCGCSAPRGHAGTQAPSFGRHIFPYSPGSRGRRERGEGYDGPGLPGSVYLTAHPAHEPVCRGPCGPVGCLGGRCQGPGLQTPLKGGDFCIQGADLHRPRVSPGGELEERSHP